MLERRRDEDVEEAEARRKHVMQVEVFAVVEPQQHGDHGGLPSDLLEEQ